MKFYNWCFRSFLSKLLKLSKCQKHFRNIQCVEKLRIHAPVIGEDETMRHILDVDDYWGENFPPCIKYCSQTPFLVWDVVCSVVTKWNKTYTPTSWSIYAGLFFLSFRHVLKSNEIDLSPKIRSKRVWTLSQSELRWI